MSEIVEGLGGEQRDRIKALRQAEQFFWVDVSNPFPWASGSWPVSGPTAFTGRELDRIGITVTVRTP